jgi:hypothetical protein
MMTRNLLPVLACLAIGACASTGGEKSIPVAGAIVCEDPRPEVCTMDYRPVCGTLKDGSIKTYPNGCGACADINVTSWVENACPE